MSEGRVVGDYKILCTLGKGAQGTCVHKPCMSQCIAHSWNSLHSCPLLEFTPLLSFQCWFSLDRVKKAQRKDGSIVALKLMKKSGLDARSSFKMRREVKIMMQCKHPCIVKFLGGDWDFIYTKKDGSTVPCVMMELEFAPGGELSAIWVWLVVSQTI